MPTHRHVLPGNQISHAFFRPLAERLTAFLCVDTPEADLMLRLRRVEDVDGVAIDDPHNAP